MKSVNEKVYQALGGIYVDVDTPENDVQSGRLTDRAIGDIWLALRERGLDIVERSDDAGQSVKVRE